MPGGRDRHRRARHCGCRGRVLLALEFMSALWLSTQLEPVCNIRLLKLVTGVDTSTRPARRLGRPGKTVNSSNLSAAAPPKRSALCLSTAIFAQLWKETRHGEHVEHRGALLVFWRLGGPLLSSAGGSSSAFKKSRNDSSPAFQKSAT